jgi:hypothetical protein
VPLCPPTGETPRWTAGGPVLSAVEGTPALQRALGGDVPMSSRFVLLVRLFTIGFDLGGREYPPLNLGAKTIWNSPITIQPPLPACTGVWKAVWRT